MSTQQRNPDTSIQQDTNAHFQWSEMELTEQMSTTKTGSKFGPKNLRPQKQVHLS